MKPCLIAGCERQAGVPGTARGLCSMHYTRDQRHGDPLWEPPVRIERFMAKVDMDGPAPQYAPHLNSCWLWTGAISGAGYGQFKGETRQEGAHRWLWEFLYGDVGDGLDLDHLCRVRHCVNPNHLEPVTASENSRRSPVTNAAKTHCVNGHEFTDENTRIDEGGWRQCRTCDRARCREYRARKKVAS